MAYMNQVKKAKIAAALKRVVPKSWKYSLRCDRHAITMTVSQAPIPLAEIVAPDPNSTHYEYVRKNHDAFVTSAGSLSLNEYYPHNSFSGKTLKTVHAVISALNTDNHDRSDIQTDYFDVGHYIHLDFGKWNKPFINTAN